MTDEQLSLFGSKSVIDVTHAKRYEVGGEASMTVKAMIDACSLRYGGNWDDDLCSENHREVRCWHHPKKANIYIHIMDHAYSVGIYDSKGKGLPLYHTPEKLLLESQLFNLLDIYLG